MYVKIWTILKGRTQMDFKLFFAYGHLKSILNVHLVISNTLNLIFILAFGGKIKLALFWNPNLFIQTKHYITIPWGLHQSKSSS